MERIHFAVGVLYDLEHLGVDTRAKANHQVRIGIHFAHTAPEQLTVQQRANFRIGVEPVDQEARPGTQVGGKPPVAAPQVNDQSSLDSRGFEHLVGHEVTLAIAGPSLDPQQVEKIGEQLQLALQAESIGLQTESLYQQDQFDVVLV